MKFLMRCPMRYWPDYLMNLLYFRDKSDAIKRAQTATWQTWAVNEVKKHEQN